MRTSPWLSRTKSDGIADMPNFNTNEFRIIFFTNISGTFGFGLPRIPNHDVRHRTWASHLQTIVDHQRITIFAPVFIDTIRFTGEFNRLIVFLFRLTAIDFIQITNIVKARSTQKNGSTSLDHVEKYLHFCCLDVIYGKIGVKQGGEIEWMIVGILNR